MGDQLAVQEALAEARKTFARQRHLRKLELNEARKDEAAAEERFNAATPGTRVFVHLEGRFEAAKAKIEQLEKAIDAEPAEYSLLDESAFASLKDLLAHPQKIFWSETTSNFDRKRVIDLGIEEVNKEKRTKEVIRGTITWRDRGCETRFEVLLNDGIKRMIAGMIDEGLDDGEIARRLNEEGLLNQRLQPWTNTAIGAARRSIQRTRRNG